jgi:hypothetical protein
MGLLVSRLAIGRDHDPVELNGKSAYLMECSNLERSIRTYQPRID